MNSINKTDLNIHNISNVPLPQISIKSTWIISLSFALIIIVSNYLVNFRILDTHITYGALTYPIMFLLMDILSEKYSRRDVLKCLRFAPFLAFFPSLYIIDNVRIAFASISAFLCSQIIDIFIFYHLKKRYPNLWWVRIGASANIAQVIDTFVFFHIVFLFTIPYYDIFIMSSFDYMIKTIASIINIPIFYLVAIKTYKRIRL